ncbi:MAG: hypothetical protein JXQ99_00425 [Hyphomicrobiaceae bacterium]
MPRADAPLVTLDVVSQRFIAAGLPRSIRTLQRYCANGTLDCVKEVTDTGDTYFVTETSIAPAIKSLRQLHEAKKQQRQGATEPVVSDDVAPAIAPIELDDHVGPRPTETDDDAQKTRERHGASNDDMSDAVAQLKERLSEKDEEIAFLREELIDRRGQIKDMKGIIDGQNQLLEVIQRNVAPIFKSLASTVEQGRITLRDTGEGSAQDARTHLEQTSDDRIL